MHVARYIPQSQLLPHCSAVVSHAGSEPSSRRFPPKSHNCAFSSSRDSFLNAAACAASGHRSLAATGNRSAEQVRDAVTRLLSDSSFRAAAGRVSREIAAMPSAHDVAERCTTTTADDRSGGSLARPRGTGSDGDLPRQPSRRSKAKALDRRPPLRAEKTLARAQPTAQDENAFLESHTWASYGEWHLAINLKAKPEPSALRVRLRRLPAHSPMASSPVTTARRVASQDVELAAHRLLQYFDKKR